MAGGLYQPLHAGSQQIRLLVLEPGGWEDTLAGRLIIESLGSAMSPEYETVSYAWGNSPALTEMRLNGTLTRVPVSSAAALRRLRLVDEERILWIDSVCINQTDLDEKADQVAIMSTIYRSGRLNLVFLGEDDEVLAEQTIRAIDSLGDHLMRLQAEATPEQLASIQQHRPDDRFRSPQTVAMLSALQPLFFAVWFTRIWVLQEVALAPRSQCHWGNHSFPLTKVLKILYTFSMVPAVVRCLKQQWSTNAYESYTCAAWMSTFLPSLRQYRLPVCNEIFIVTRSFSNRVPHDKIYAILAIIQAESPQRTIPETLRPNYHKPLLELYRDSTRFVLQHSIAPFILRCISHRSVADMTQEGKTSWTWLWDRQFDGNQDPDTMGHALDTPKPTRETTNRFEIQDVGDPNILAITGFIVDAVDWVIPMRSADLQGTVRRLLEFVRTCCSMTDSEEEAKDILSKVLTLGSGPDVLRGFGGKAQTRLAYNEWIEYVSREMNFPKMDDLSSVSLFEEHFRSATSERSVFTTSSGLIGVGPKIMSEGDMLALFIGGNSSSILRPWTDSYRYVGAGYTHRVTENMCHERGLIPTLLKLR